VITTSVVLQGFFFFNNIIDIIFSRSIIIVEKNELDNLKINFLFNGKKFIEDAIRNMMIEVKG